MVVMTGSLPLIMRVMIIVQAQASAETIGKNAAGWNALEPGRRIISTPINPTAVASQRRTPTLSPRNTIDSAVTSINCRPRRPDGKAYNGDPGSIAGNMIIPKTRNLIQAISIDGNVAERYFAVASEAPRNTVDARISAMPRNGRSARAGALGFVRGNGNEARSSLTAAAGGEVTIKLGP